MPIYDLSYRPYRGDLTGHTWRWLTIAKAGLGDYLKRRIFMIFLFISYVHPIGRGFFIWGTHQLGARSFDVVDAAFFRNTLFIQGLFLLLVCIWPGATLIAQDLRTNAIQLYLSKPLSRLDYVLGKFAIIAGIGVLLIPVPGLLLFLMELGLSTDLNFLANHYWVPLAMAGYSAVIITGAGLLALAISSVTRSGRYAGLMFFGIVFFSQAAGRLLGFLTGEAAFIVLSLISLVDQAGGIFFGGEVEFGLHPFTSSVAFAVLLGLCALILRRRVKAVEIVT